MRRTRRPRRRLHSVSKSRILRSTAMSDPVVTPAAEPDADFAAFEARENALATGDTPDAEPTPEPQPTLEPEPALDAAPAPDKSLTPPSPTSKRTERRQQRDQDQINETIRRAVQEATEAMQDAEALLKSADDQVLIAGNHVRKLIVEEFPPKQHERMRNKYLPGEHKDDKPFSF